MIIIFSCWKTMIGTAVAALPWTFQQSGIVLGVILSFTSFLISFYTCKLIIEMAGTDPDYSDTLKKFYGKYLPINHYLLTCSNFWRVFLLYRQVRLLRRTYSSSCSHSGSCRMLLCHYELSVIPNAASHLRMDGGLGRE